MLFRSSLAFSSSSPSPFSYFPLYFPFLFPSFPLFHQKKKKKKFALYVYVMIRLCYDEVRSTDEARKKVPAKLGKDIQIS